jgi:3-isopropylmalate/(R)-2-methylmalate dehydratase large subunit
VARNDGGDIVTGRTIAEKIFSAHAGSDVRAGDSVVASIDAAMATDGSGPLTIDLFRKMGGTSVFDPDKVVMVFDHYVPCPNDKVAALHDSMRDFAKAGLCRLTELGEGICHQLMPEKGLVRPGHLIVGGDSHSTTYGAFNAIGTGIGSSDLAAAMIAGKLWFNVPGSIRIDLSGRLAGYATAKDLALTIVGLLGADGAIYKSLEFAGPGVAGLTIDDRMTVCNMMVETGAKCAVMPGDAVTRAFFDGPVAFVAADPDAVYERVIAIDLAAVEPMLAMPHQVDTVDKVAAHVGLPVQMGVLGTCTNGRLNDLTLALEVMGDAPLAPGFELLIIPASRKVYLQALREGVVERFVDKGAVILPPGCGPCCGSSPGIPSAGENIVSTANRNFIGRMGNVKANIHLASPAVVAASAVTGRITLPKKGD